MRRVQLLRRVQSCVEFGYCVEFGDYVEDSIVVLAIALNRIESQNPQNRVGVRIFAETC